MGFCADSVDVDFTVPPENLVAALAAANVVVGTAEVPGEFESLSDLFIEYTGFQDNEESTDLVGTDSNGEEYVAQGTGWWLGYHNDKYLSLTEPLLRALAPYAVEGSTVRFIGEDASQWGFRVVDGVLRDETAEWVLAPSRDQPETGEHTIRIIGEQVSEMLEGIGAAIETLQGNLSVPTGELIELLKRSREIGGQIWTDVTKADD